MARKAVEKTPLQLEHEKAVVAAAKARDHANKPNATDKDKTAATALTKTAHEIGGRVRIENFERIGKLRVNNSIKATRLIGALFNPKAYTYDEAKGLKAINAVRAECDKLEAKLKASLASGGTIATDEGFTF